MEIVPVINANCQLVFPIMGDSELFQVKFCNPNLFLFIKQYYPQSNEHKIIQLKIIKCIHCNIESDHMQNVVSEIHIFDQKSKIRIFSKIFESKINKILEVYEHLKFKIIVIEPTSGIEFFALCDDVEFKIMAQR